MTADQLAPDGVTADGASPGASTAAADVATWSVVLIALFSVTIRPFVETTGLPSFLVNLDALLVPLAASGVAAVSVATWRTLSRGRRLLTLSITGTALLLLLAWVTAETRSLASLALGASMVLLLPLGLYLVVMATGARRHALVRSTLCLLVLLQLAVGVLQYVALQVAQKAPTGADLVDGTTSHNFWPVFALPASMALVVTGRGGTRYLWPGSVALLAVYAEAKAALIVWLPIIAVVLVLDLVQRRRTGQQPARARSDRGTTLALGASFAAIVAIGIWWTPSVQGTWEVFVGHSAQLEQFAADGDRPTGGPTLRQGASAVADELTADPRSFLLGLGPANSTTHAAEVLARGAKNGVSLPAPGPLAAELLTGTDALKFRDAQSSLLGVWGDLGTAGAAAYLALCAACTGYLVTRFRGGSFGDPRGWAVLGMVGGILAGGTLLDWPEQASVVMPVMLACLLVSTHTARGAASSVGDSGRADSEGEGRKPSPLVPDS